MNDSTFTVAQLKHRPAPLALLDLPTSGLLSFWMAVYTGRGSWHGTLLYAVRVHTSVGSATTVYNERGDVLTTPHWFAATVACRIEDEVASLLLRQVAPAKELVYSVSKVWVVETHHDRDTDDMRFVHLRPFDTVRWGTRRTSEYSALTSRPALANEVTACCDECSVLDNLDGDKLCPTCADRHANRARYADIALVPDLF